MDKIVNWLMWLRREHKYSYVFLWSAFMTIAAAIFISLSLIWLTFPALLALKYNSAWWLLYIITIPAYITCIWFWIDKLFGLN